MWHKVLKHQVVNHSSILVAFKRLLLWGRGGGIKHPQSKCTIWILLGVKLIRKGHVHKNLEANTTLTAGTRAHNMSISQQKFQRELHKQTNCQLLAVSGVVKATKSLGRNTVYEKRCYSIGHFLCKVYPLGFLVADIPKGKAPLLSGWDVHFSAIRSLSTKFILLTKMTLCLSLHEGESQSRISSYFEILVRNKLIRVKLAHCKNSAKADISSISSSLEQ